MKTLFLIFITAIIPISIFATPINNITEDLLTVPSAQIENYEVIETTDACTVVRIRTKDGKIIINIIAAIATAFLPETAYGLCMLTVGNKNICEAVYDVTDALIMLSGGRVQRGITKGIAWIAKKGTYRSSATIETTSSIIADGVKTVFQAYKDQDCVNWQSIGYNEQCDCSGSITFYTNVENHGSISVYIEGYYIGKITQYWKSGSPDCDEYGTASIALPPGRYSFYAKTNCKCSLEWNGYITIESNLCRTMKLTNN